MAGELRDSLTSVLMNLANVAAGVLLSFQGNRAVSDANMHQVHNRSLLTFQVRQGNVIFADGV